MSSGQPRRAAVWIRLALLGGTVLVSLVLAEASLRVLSDRLPVSLLVYLHRSLKDERPEVWTKLRQYLPYLNLRREDLDTGWTFKPGTAYSGTNEDGEPYALTTSAEGFFTPDTPPRQSQQLVVLGDSFLSTFYVSTPLAWALRNELGEPVYNLAVHGWGPENYLAAYHKFAEDRRHTQVLVFTFMNDITDVMNWGNWRREGTAGQSFLTWIQRQNPDDDAVNNADSWLDKRSFLWNFLKLTSRQRFKGPPITLQPTGAPLEPIDPGRVETLAGGNGRAFQMQLTRGFPFLVNDPAAFWPGGSYYPYLQAYFESLYRIKSAVEARGAQMVLVWIPSKERVHIPLLPPDRRAQYVSTSTGDIDGLEPVVTAYAAQTGTPFLDLTAELSRRAAGGEKLYFTIDGHLNGAGNQVAGTRVASFLKALPEAPPALVGAAPLVMFRRGPLSISVPLTLNHSNYRAPALQASGFGLAHQAVAESTASYLVRWPVSSLTTPMFLVAKGVLRRGGLTIGLHQNDVWALQTSVTSPGAFEIALAVPKPGAYAVVIANNLPTESLENDFEITELGWAPVQP